MAEPANLIQIQSSLQDPFTVKNEDLIKYANGSNPEVPPFLALIEMNRRKQIEDSNAAFQTSSKATIKDQVAGSLAAAPTGIDLTQNPYTVNPAAAQKAVNPAASPFGQGITQLPQGVNPIQAPPTVQPSPEKPVMAAEGGLMSLPVNHFNENSYAGGGIVAFGNPDLNPDEQQLVSFPQERQNRRVLTDAQIAAELAKSQAAPVIPRPAPKPGSYEGILASLPPAPEINAPAPEAMNRAQAYEGIKESQRLAGVAADPYAEVKQYQAKKEKREQEAYERGGIDRLVAQASAFAKADPARGIGYQSAVAAEASQVLQKEQDILRDKQEAAAIEFHKSLAKEEDAKRRGDAAGIEAAVTAREKAQMDFEKLRFDAAKVQNDRGMLAANIFHTTESAATQRAANANTAAYQKGMLDYHQTMADLAKEQKPTAEEKKILKVEAIAAAHPVVKAIADGIKQGTIQIGTQEYYEAVKEMNEFVKPLYIKAGLTPPEDIVRNFTAAPAKKLGFFDRLFGSSPNTVTSAPVGSNVSAAPPPPEVQKILDKYK